MTATLVFAAWVELFASHRPEFVIGLFIAAIGVMFGVLTLAVLTLAGPCEMRFDLGSRTYRVRRGPPLFAGTLTGPISDFDYLYLRGTVYYNYGSRTTETRLSGVWRRAPRLFGFVPQPELLLQLVYNADTAYDQAVEIAALLGLPLEMSRRTRGQDAPAEGSIPAPGGPTAQSNGAPDKSAGPPFAPSTAPVAGPPPHLASQSGPVPETPVDPAAPSTGPASASLSPGPVTSLSAPAQAVGAAGRVVRADWPLLDVQFDASRVPPAYTALSIADPVWNERTVATVAQQLPGGVARCLLRERPARSLVGLDASDTGGPDARAPWAAAVAEAIAQTGRELYAGAAILETGLKAIDLLCPVPMGGRAALSAPWGAGALVLIPELIRSLETRQGALRLIAMLELGEDVSRWRESMQELPMRYGDLQTVYLPAGSLADPAVRAQVEALDSIIVLARGPAKQGLYPPVDPAASESKLLREGRADRDHAEIAAAVRDVLTRYRAAYPALEAAVADALPAAERGWVARARRLERFLTQPFHVAEPYTGIAGKTVPLSETIRGCRAILVGDYDDLPEQALYMIGGIDEARH
ncbi:MAG TPA: hypothetical protein VKT77_21535 [Chthonomonadaceae bacterium]|nr:hypothetical protein [Chthonomonadaceae bacterium]